jgi:hypothetical protein
MVPRRRLRLKLAQMSDDLSGEYAIHKYRHIEAVHADPATTLGQLIDACNEASAEDLGWLAILVLEPFLDHHWAEVKNAFVEALRTHPRLRQAYRSAVVLHIPPDAERLFDSASEPD